MKYETGMLISKSGVYARLTVTRKRNKAGDRLIRLTYYYGWEWTYTSGHRKGQTRSWIKSPRHWTPDELTEARVRIIKRIPSPKVIGDRMEQRTGSRL